MCTSKAIIRSSCVKCILSLGLAALMTGVLSAGDPGTGRADLAQLSIEDLMRVEVTSVTRRSRPLSRSAAAIFVITRDDIKRSGATTVPELLRMAPGLFVSRLDGSKWSVSSRSPGGRYVSNMLVLVDGRTVYTPLFSGVLWENHEFIMEDIDRIEVIRGPGAVVWGSNAVSGVINIITRNAARTKGDLVSTTVGNLSRPVVEMRHGGAIGAKGAYRVFGRVARYGNMVDERGREVEDGYSTNMGGFRLDLNQGRSTRWMLEGSGQSGTIHQRDSVISPDTGMPPIVDSSGGMTAGHILGRWSRTSSGGQETRVQFYYDRFHRQPFLAEERQTVDLDLGHGFRLGSRHGLVAGGGYRYSWDSIPATPRVSLIPPEKGIDLLNGYLQDEIRLAETVSLSLGARLEQSRFSGSTFQPAAQFLWTPSDRQSVWASVSRALRTPSRGEQGFSISLGVIPTGLVGNPLPVSVTTLGKKDMRSEILHSYEAGYRNQLSTRLSLDVAAYYYNYSQLRAVTAAGGPYLVFVPIPHIQMVFQTANGGYSTNWGGELTANLKVSDRWRLFATYSRLQQRQKLAPNMWNAAMANMPHNLATVRSQTDLGQRLSFDTDLDFSGRQYDGLGGNKDLLLSTIQSNPLAELDKKPGNYLRWDARLTWRISPNWELTAGGENLLDKYHKELDPEILMVGSLVKRSLFVRLIWRH